MKKLLLLGCALLVIAVSVVAATTIKADVGNNPRQLVVDAKWVNGGPPSSALDTGERSWMKFVLFPKDQIDQVPAIGEKFIDFIAIAPVGTSASFNEELYVIGGKGTIFCSWYHYGGPPGEGIITGGTGEFQGASGVYWITMPGGVIRTTFYFDNARNMNP